MVAWLCRPISNGWNSSFGYCDRVSPVGLPYAVLVFLVLVLDARLLGLRGLFVVSDDLVVLVAGFIRFVLLLALGLVVFVVDLGLPVFAVPEPPRFGLEVERRGVEREGRSLW